METQSLNDGRHGRSKSLIAAGFTGLLVAYFFYFVPGFGPEQLQSPLVWLKYSWNAENDYEHGILIPGVMIGLLLWQRKSLSEALDPEKRTDLWGLAIALMGGLFFVLAHRTGQARLALGGLPMILWGASWFFWGWRVAWLTFFPLFIFWLAIPVPQFQQATTELQILSTKLAQAGCELFGVDTEVRGTQIHSVTDKWHPLEIDEGCGGIRSLMALILISSVWAYLAKMALWKKILLCLSAFPLAILGNTLRLTSIFVIAEYGNAEFAASTWHDWSGLALFYPISMLMLLALHSILEGGLPKLSQFRPLQRTQVTTQATADTPPS